MRNCRSGTERTPGRCAGPLAATPIATDLPGRMMRTSPEAEVRAARTGEHCASTLRLRQARGTVTVQVSDRAVVVCVTLAPPGRVPALAFRTGTACDQVV